MFAADQSVYWNTAAQQASPTAGVLMGVALAGRVRLQAHRATGIADADSEGSDI